MRRHDPGETAVSADAQICRTCGGLRILPGGGRGPEKCPACSSTDVETLPLSGKGKLYSYTRVHVPTRMFQDDAPYWLVLVELEEGHRVMGRLADDDTARPAIEAHIEIDLIDDRGPLFRLAY